MGRLPCATHSHGSEGFDRRVSCPNFVGSITCNKAWKQYGPFSAVASLSLATIATAAAVLETLEARATHAEFSSLRFILFRDAI